MLFYIGIINKIDVNEYINQFNLFTEKDEGK